MILVQERIKSIKSSGAKIYELVLLDYSMPVMDGPQFARELIRVLTEAENLPLPFICCCTAYPEAAFKR